MNVGTRIRELRLKHGMTLEALAKKLYVTKQAISKWERCESYPKPENLERLQDVFHVSMGYLLGDDLNVPHNTLKVNPTSKSCVDADLAVEYRELSQCNTRHILKGVLCSMTLLVAGLCVSWLCVKWHIELWMNRYIPLLAYLTLTGSAIFLMYRTAPRSLSEKFRPIDSGDFFLDGETLALVESWKHKYEDQARINSSMCTLGIMGLLLWYLDTGFDSGWSFSIESTIILIVGLMIIISMCMPLAQEWYVIRKLLHEVAPSVPTPFNREFWIK